MLWGLVLQGLLIVQAIMGKLVAVTYHFNTMPDGQWNLTSATADVSEKGSAIIGDLATIIHYGLDFVAQFTFLLPAISSVSYEFTGNTINAGMGAITF